MKRKFVFGFMVFCAFSVFAARSRTDGRYKPTSFYVGLSVPISQLAYDTDTDVIQNQTQIGLQAGILYTMQNGFTFRFDIDMGVGIYKQKSEYEYSYISSYSTYTIGSYKYSTPMYTTKKEKVETDTEYNFASRYNVGAGYTFFNNKKCKLAVTGDFAVGNDMYFTAASGTKSSSHTDLIYFQLGADVTGMFELSKKMGVYASFGGYKILGGFSTASDKLKGDFCLVPALGVYFK
ncbi:MAG: hypothetical protein II921_03630 [Treponema sp.]|nr:hypothetical protein [Treponema sp.]